VVTAGWTRLLMVVAAIAGGADAPMMLVVTDILLPGLLIDFALLAVVYAPLRLLGLSGQGMALSRGGYYTGL
jgi:hypothetical protein